MQNEANPILEPFTAVESYNGGIAAGTSPPKQGVNFNLKKS